MSNCIENTYAQALNGILDFVSGSKNAGYKAIEQVIRETFSLAEALKKWNTRAESKVLSVNEIALILLNEMQTLPYEKQLKISMQDKIAKAIFDAMEAKNE